eukprot:Lankesteria_metandrocarpae@DN3506_c0_g1_i3.p1
MAQNGTTAQTLASTSANFLYNMLSQSRNTTTGVPPASPIQSSDSVAETVPRKSSLPSGSKNHTAALEGAVETVDRMVGLLEGLGYVVSPVTGASATELQLQPHVEVIGGDATTFISGTRQDALVEGATNDAQEGKRRKG